MWSDASPKRNATEPDSDFEFSNETEPVDPNFNPQRDMYLGVYGGLGFGQVTTDYYLGSIFLYCKRE